jgi:Xaa-Pro aminopeptidase
MNKFTKALSEAIRGKADAALIISEANRFYYTGFPASDGFLLVTAAGAIFYTDSRYTEAAVRKLGEKYVRNSATVFPDLTAEFEKQGVKTVAVEADRLTLAEFANLQNRLPGVSFVSDATLTDLIEAQRSVKTDEEIEKMTAAQRIAEAAFDHILGFIKPGITEKEVGLELDYYMLSHGADALSFETIAVSGVNSSLPHGVPSEKKIEIGDFVTMDYGAVKDGYHSDMTRTIAVGKVNDEQKLVYETVLKAQLASLNTFKAGVSCFDGDKAARDVIREAGYGDYFGHGTGHGVGVEIHEFPRVSFASKTIFEAGHVVTAEPGIYLPGKFGVRIEDMALITETGCIDLTRCPKELIVL